MFTNICTSDQIAAGTCAPGSDLTVIAYLLYIVISVAATVWVAHTLSKNGSLFLVDVFAGNEKLAVATNHLLVVGFYLINFGWMSLQLTMGHTVPTIGQLIESLSMKVGPVFIVLGIMHFFNLFIFSQIRASKRPRQIRYVDPYTGMPLPPVPPAPTAPNPAPQG
jgi:hypothetical protein